MAHVVARGLRLWDRIDMRFFHKHLRRLLLFFLRRHPNLALDALRHHPNLAVDALRQQNSLSFANFPDRPQRNFEDLDWLLVSNSTNKGLLMLSLMKRPSCFDS